MKHNFTLQNLVDRAEIQDALMRYLRGVDRIDEELILSAFWPDADVAFPGDVYQGGAKGFADFLCHHELPTFTRTQHFVGNISIELEGDIAYTETYLTANHRASMEHKWKGQHVTLWARYIDRFERRDGEWRIAQRKFVLDWQRDDNGGGWRDIPTEQLSRRDGTDPIQTRDLSKA